MYVNVVMYAAECQEEGAHPSVLRLPPRTDFTRFLPEDLPRFYGETIDPNCVKAKQISPFAVSMSPTLVEAANSYVIGATTDGTRVGRVVDVVRVQLRAGFYFNHTLSETYLLPSFARVIIYVDHRMRDSINTPTVDEIVGHSSVFGFQTRGKSPLYTFLYDELIALPGYNVDVSQTLLCPALPLVQCDIPVCVRTIYDGNLGPMQNGVFVAVFWFGDIPGINPYVFAGSTRWLYVDD